jgi:uncharacterized membrane protein (UPF0136 family)
MPLRSLPWPPTQNESVSRDRVVPKAILLPDHLLKQAQRIKIVVSFGVRSDYIATGKETMNPHTVLWIYIVLLVIGGLIGFLKAKSQVSLIMSVAFAAALSLCAAGVVFQPYVADLLLAALLVVFGLRLVKTKKFMPAGLMLVITILVLALRHIRF